MSDGAVNDSSYNGTYEYSVDNKGRLANPFRDGVEGGTGDDWLMVVVWPWHAAGTCLRVFPPVQAKKLLADLDAIPNSDQSKGSLKRYIGGNSVRVKMDSAGRFNLPEKMRNEAGISDKAIVAGMWDKFEVWEPKRHEKSLKLDAPVLAPAVQQYLES